MNSTEQSVLQMLDQVLSLDGRALSFTRDTHLMGAVPELDSMAAVALLTSIEEHFGVLVEDDEIDGNTFASVGSLIDFVQARLPS